MTISFFKTKPLVMQNYRNLLVWQKSHQLTLEVYRVTKTFPCDEQFGLTSQLKRACSSNPTNLAEGSGKLTQREFRRYVLISFGSSNELEYLLFLSFELHYLTEAEFMELDAQIKEVKRMLAGLINAISKKIIISGLFILALITSCYFLYYLV